MEQRTCNKCHQLKPLTEFYKTGRKNDTNPNNRHYTCKECTKARVSAAHAANPDRARQAFMRRVYGITIADYDQLLKDQNYSCAICPTTEPGGKHNVFNVDHCHSTGKVRALLCRNCNMLLGMAKDRPEYLTQLIAYLAKHS